MHWQGIGRAAGKVQQQGGDSRGDLHHKRGDGGAEPVCGAASPHHGQGSKWDAKGSRVRENSDTENGRKESGVEEEWESDVSDGEKMECLRQEIGEGEEDYRRVTEKVTAAEAELRRIQTRQRQVTKEMRKVQTMAEGIASCTGKKGWTSVSQSEIAKVSVGEECRRVGQPALGGSGEEIAAAMATATTGVLGWKGEEVFTRKKTKGLQIFNYDGAVAPHFERRTTDGGEVTAGMMRRESRGLVLGSLGVVARPMHKFFEEGQVSDFSYGQISDTTVQEARKKLDGMMVFGVVHPTEGWVELWTRAGPTGPGKWVTRFAESGDAGDVIGLVVALDNQGYTACFEWVGGQIRIKERHDEVELVVTQVRHKGSGEYMEWGQMERWATQHRVKCVQRVSELEGLTVREVTEKVQAMEGVEGLVVRIQGGTMMKIKTSWWHKQQAHWYYRWHSADQQEHEENRRQWKSQMMQVQGCRAVLEGWPTERSPALILDKLKATVKVEEFIARKDGRRGAIILSFRSSDEKDDAIVKAKEAGMELRPAYSSRSNGNAWHKIRTYWEGGSHRLGG